MLRASALPRGFACAESTKEKQNKTTLEKTAGEVHCFYHSPMRDRFVGWNSEGRSRKPRVSDVCWVGLLAACQEWHCGSKERMWWQYYLLLLPWVFIGHFFRCGVAPIVLLCVITIDKWTMRKCDFRLCACLLFYDTFSVKLSLLSERRKNDWPANILFCFLKPEARHVQNHPSA